MSSKELHKFRELLAIICGGIQTGRLDLALEAARKMSSFLASFHPDHIEVF